MEIMKEEAPSVPDLKFVLRRIVANPSLHARWLNTLSYLEYLGFRKIVKSLVTQDVTLEGLRHMQEEGRHALVLKKQAMRLGTVPAYSAEYLLAAVAAFQYMSVLDKAATRLTEGTTFSPYRIVTALVEIRAVSVYSVYRDEILGQGGSSSFVDNLLTEEEGHLAEVQGQLVALAQEKPDAAEELRALERVLYKRFLRELAHEVDV